LEDGYLTDAAGTKISFTNTVIIMTSNLGSQYWSGQVDIGFERSNNISNTKKPNNIETKLLAEIKKQFKPEFINRLDQIICFNSLTLPELQKIADKELEKLASRLKKEKGISLKYNQSITKIIAQKSQDPADPANNRGARGVLAAIKNSIENDLADKILKRKPKPEKTLRLTVKSGIITLS
jgi:ATP-dependent Clp protease ATP-binding subunit ClpC